MNRELALLAAALTFAASSGCAGRVGSGSDSTPAASAHPASMQPSAAASSATADATPVADATVSSSASGGSTGSTGTTAPAVSTQSTTDASSGTVALGGGSGGNTATSTDATQPTSTASTTTVAAPTATTSAPPDAATTAPADTTAASTQSEAFRGDSSPMPSFGGWAWGNVPADAVAAAGFDWFELGYPGDTNANQILASARVRPFAYINIGELEPSLASAAAYTGAVLRTNGEWGTQLVDVTDPSWQSWIVRRADYAYATGSRGVKWDVATPDVPPGKTRDDVNAAMASMMEQIRQSHPDLKFIFNQGFLFALAYPQYVDGVETEGLFSASSYPGAYLQPWVDPWYWGPQFDQAQTIHQNGTPIFCAEYADPSSSTASDLYAAIVAQGFVPYITDEGWDIRGWGYGVPPGW